jgi:acetyl-CoA acetyltransferase
VLRDTAAIVGIGQTEFSKSSGRSELQLASECVKAALDDAGLSPADVDGMTTFSMDTSQEIEVARAVGIGDLRFFSRVEYGGGAAVGVLLHAVMAVATGVADTVVVYRAFNERSGRRYSTGISEGIVTSDLVHWSWYLPFGLLTPPSWVAMFAQRYMHETGATSLDLGRIAVATRRHAVNNPNAWFHGRPITLEDHQASRLIAEPLRLLDCCQEQMTSYYRESITRLPEMDLVAKQVYATSGLGPDDVDAAVIYDAFSPIVMWQLESFGFCAWGEAKDFVKDGHLELGGRLPTNTNGGQLSEAYIHGMNGVNEGVRLVRGTSVNQPERAEHVLVTGGVGVPTSGMILGKA